MYKYCSLFILLVIFSCSDNSNNSTFTGTDSATTLAKATVQEMDQETFKIVNKKSGVFVLDVRTPAEIADGKIRGAIEVDYKAAGFKDKLDKLPRDKKYIIYCKSGGRSSKTANMMVDMGFQEVFNLTGGFSAYTEE